MVFMLSLRSGWFFSAAGILRSKLEGKNQTTTTEKQLGFRRQ